MIKPQVFYLWHGGCDTSNMAAAGETNTGALAEAALGTEAARAI